MPGLPRVIEGQEKKADEMIAQLAKAQIVEVVKDTPHPAEEGNPPAESKPVVDTPHAESAPAGEDFQQKYLVLQGKYNNEIADWKRRLDVAQQTIDRQNNLVLELHERLSGLEKGAKAPTGDDGGTSEPNADELKNLDPEEFQGYGPEMTDLVLGFNKLLKRNKHLESMVESRSKEQEDRVWNDFETRMTELVPDWQVINVDPAFKDVWLYQKNGRLQLLKHYNQTLDVAGCAEMFNQYKAETGAASANPPPPKREQIVQPNASAAGPGAPIAGNPNQTVTAADVKAAGARYVKGEISYDELEKIQDAFQRSLAKRGK